MIPTKRNNNCCLIQKKSTVEGKFNDTVTWVYDREVWLSITPERGREKFSSDELKSVVSHKIRGDYLELNGVDETMRIILSKDMTYDPISNDADVYDILAVMPDEDGHADILISAVKENRPYGQQS